MDLRFRKPLNIFSFLGKGPSRGSFFFYVHTEGVRMRLIAPTKKIIALF